MNDNFFNLTPREGEVMAWLLEGRTNSEIADELDMEVSTVKFHLGHIYNKLGVRNRFEAFVKWNERYDNV